MPPAMMQRNGRRSSGVQQKQKTTQYRKFRGMNRTDARTAIDDDELFWLENALPVGNGAIQIVPGQSNSVATITGAHTIWGAVLNGTAVMLVVASDGSITQVTPGGVTTVVAPAGTVTTDAHMTVWQGTRYLIIDPVKGYFTWDGATFTTIDATKLGSAIAVFEGRVWIGRNRTIEFTAPTTYNDFTVGNGAGSTIITDDAFIGNIVALYSALEQLWIVSAASINAISNVQASGTAPNVVTTFTNTNIVTNLGSSASNSVIAYFRSLTLLAPFGAYALAGVTPQKLSDKLDGLFPMLTFADAPAAVAMVQSLPVLMYLTTYTGADLSSGWNATTAPLLICFTQGKWFVGVQGLQLVGITTLINAGVPQAWGCYTDGTIRQLFGAAATATVNYKIQSKLYDFGDATTEKALMKVGVEIQASTDVTIAMTVDSEFGSQTVTVQTSNALILQNVAATAAERVVNGGFGTAAGEAPNFTGWTAGGAGGTVAASVNGAVLTSPGAGQSATLQNTTPITVVGGRNHLFTFQGSESNKTGNTMSIVVTDSDTAAVLLSASFVATGTQPPFSASIPVPALTTHIRITITCNVVAGASPAVMTIDNISLKDEVVLNAGPQTLQLINNLSNPLNIIAQGTVLSRQNADLFGRYLGWTLQGTSAPFRLQAIQFEVVPTRQWQTG